MLCGSAIQGTAELSILGGCNWALGILLLAKGRIRGVPQTLSWGVCGDRS